MRVHDPAWCTASGLQASEYPRGVPGLALPDAVTLVAGLCLAGIPGSYACGIVGPRLLRQHGSHSRTVRASSPFTALFPEERTAPGMARGLLPRAQVTSMSTGGGGAPRAACGLPDTPTPGMACGWLVSLRVSRPWKGSLLGTAGLLHWSVMGWGLNLSSDSQEISLRHRGPA